MINTEPKVSRRRIHEGTLVASTNVRKSIICKRLIVKVQYSPLSYKILDQRASEIRTSYEQ